MLFRRTATLLSASVMVLSACGGQAGGSSASCLATDASRQSVVVTARDDRFDPACIEAAGEGDITLVVRNDGRHPHNLTFQSGDSVSVDSAQVAFITARVGREGLEYVCTLHAGMRGRIRIAQ
jgi:plastocyanin